MSPPRTVLPLMLVVNMRSVSKWHNSDTQGRAAHLHISLLLYLCLHCSIGWAVLLLSLAIV